MGSLIVGYMMILAPALVGLAACSVLGYLMLARVGRVGLGVVLGFFLGPIGIVIAWVVRDNALRDQDATARARAWDAPDPAVVGRRARTLSEELDETIALRARGEISDEEYRRRKERLIG